MTNEAIRERLAKATPGPWEAHPAVSVWIVCLDVKPCNYCVTPENAEFLKHARTDIPDLLAQVDELTAEVSRLRAERPTRYVPREEVTEGWWMVVQDDHKDREIVKVQKNIHGVLCVSVVNCDTLLPIEWFTDFLRVPAWLIDGIESEAQRDT